MKVLLASDGSEPAEQATRFLRRFLHVEQLEVTVLTGFVIPYFALDETSGDWLIELQEAAEEGAKYVRNKTEAIFKDTDIRLSFVSREGHAGSEIVQFAKKNAFDLIILGATGHSMLSRILLGSVSDYVATHAHCSVLVVRSPKNAKSEEQMLNVTIAYDGSKRAQAAIDEFSRFNWGAKVEVHLLHAAQNLYAYRERLQPITASSDPRRQAATIEKLKMVAKQLPIADPDPKVHVLEADHISQSIIDFASRACSDVIMLGDTGQSAIDHMLLGSVSRYVLRHAPMSVWIARAWHEVCK